MIRPDYIINFTYMIYCIFMAYWTATHSFACIDWWRQTLFALQKVHKTTHSRDFRAQLARGLNQPHIINYTGMGMWLTPIIYQCNESHSKSTFCFQTEPLVIEAFTIVCNSLKRTMDLLFMDAKSLRQWIVFIPNK